MPCGAGGRKSGGWHARYRIAFEHNPQKWRKTAILGGFLLLGVWWVYGVSGRKRPRFGRNVSKSTALRASQD